MPLPCHRMPAHLQEVDRQPLVYHVILDKKDVRLAGRPVGPGWDDIHGMVQWFPEPKASGIVAGSGSRTQDRVGFALAVPPGHDGETAAGMIVQTHCHR